MDGWMDGYFHGFGADGWMDGQISGCFCSHNKLVGLMDG